MLGEEVALFRHTTANFATEEMGAQNYNVGPKFLQKWGFSSPKLCIFGRKFFDKNIFQQSTPQQLYCIQPKIILIKKVTNIKTQR